MTTNTKLREALEALIDTAEQCDSWESFPTAPIEAARAALALTQHDEDGALLGYVNVKYGTFFRSAQLAASERTTEMLASGEIVMVFTRPAETAGAVDAPDYRFATFDDWRASDIDFNGESDWIDYARMAFNAARCENALPGEYSNADDLFAAMGIATPPAEKASAESATFTGTFTHPPSQCAKCGEPAESTLLPNGLSREQKREFILSHAKRAGSLEDAFFEWFGEHGAQFASTHDAQMAFEAGYQRGRQAGDALNAATDEMLDAGGEALYGHPRSSAVEWAKEDKFDSCVWQAEQVWKAMCAARASAAKEGEV